jgi:glutathione S-transferase
MRARLALLASDRVCELREVVLRDKPSEMLAASAKGTVPVLIDPDGNVLDQSLDIMLWALAQHDPEQWLQPEQGSVETMLELIGEFDREFKYHLDRYKYPDRYENTDAQTHRAQGSLYLQKLTTQLEMNPYLFGNRIALADMAIVPFVRQFAHTDQDWFNQQPWTPLQTWLATLIDSKIYTYAMKKYPKWESGTPGVEFRYG